MKALTVWQPWASLIANGWKPYEFRGKMPRPRTMQGQRIAIHAGARKPLKGEIWDLLRRMDDKESTVDVAARSWLESCLDKPHELPLSCIVCTAILGKCFSARILAERHGWINDSAREHTFNFAWPLVKIEPVPLIPARGAQGFWYWEGPPL